MFVGFSFFLGFDVVKITIHKIKSSFFFFHTVMGGIVVITLITLKLKKNGYPRIGLDKPVTRYQNGYPLYFKSPPFISFNKIQTQ